MSIGMIVLLLVGLCRVWAGAAPVLLLSQQLTAVANQGSLKRFFDFSDEYHNIQKLDLLGGASKRRAQALTSLRSQMRIADDPESVLCKEARDYFVQQIEPFKSLLPAVVPAKPFERHLASAAFKSAPRELCEGFCKLFLPYYTEFGDIPQLVYDMGKQCNGAIDQQRVELVGPRYFLAMIAKSSDNDRAQIAVWIQYYFRQLSGSALFYHAVRRAVSGQVSGVRTPDEIAVYINRWIQNNSVTLAINSNFAFVAEWYALLMPPESQLCELFVGMIDHDGFMRDSLKFFLERFERHGPGVLQKLTFDMQNLTSPRNLMLALRYFVAPAY